MLGLVLIYFIGKKFYELAEVYKKHQWGFAILGVVSYYIGAFVGGVVIAIGAELTGIVAIDEMNDYVLGLLGLPFGLLACWLTYQLLEKHWSKKVVFSDSDILDEDFIMGEQ